MTFAEHFNPPPEANLTPGWAKVAKKFPGMDMEYWNAPVYAWRAGTVIAVGKYANWRSNFIRIRHGGVDIDYGHLKTITVRKGQKVKAGQLLGRLGTMHIHLATLVNNKRVDPYPYFVAKPKPKPKPKGVGKAVANELGSRLLGRKWTAPAAFYNRNMEQFIQAIINSVEYRKKRGTDPCAVVKRELKVRITERDTERKAKESYAKRLIQVEKDNIALNSKVAYYGGRIDKLLEKMGQDEKDNKRLMENSAKALVEKEKQIVDLKDSVEKLTADASIGKSVIEIGVAVKRLLKTIWGRLGKD